MRWTSIAIMTAVTAFMVRSATSEEKPVRLSQARGLDKVEVHCGACHSLDYIRMNSPFLSAAGWDVEVSKMLNAFGARIDEADAKIIADYLTKNYGSESRQKLAGPPGIELPLDKNERSFGAVGDKHDENKSKTRHVKVAVLSAHHAKNQPQAGKQQHSRKEAVQALRDNSAYNSTAPRNGGDEIVNPADYQRGGAN